MSIDSLHTPASASNSAAPSIETILIPRTNDIGGFEVGRVLPSKSKRMVGPFVFWDQMGPGEFLTGQGVDVRPHPHIGLSTVTYLFEGSLDHKDSLGNSLRIKPGELNLMTAGSGIVHSERTGKDVRQQPSTLFGIQSWLAQPQSHEQGDPGFVHAGKSQLPTFDENDMHGRVIMGAYQGVRSPVSTQWETLYVDIRANQNALIPFPASVEERALFVVSGRLEVEGHTFDQGQMLVLGPKKDITFRATSPSHVMLLGGATMDGPRHIWWNFVASDKDLIEDAKTRWKTGSFPTVPGDEDEYIPLP